MNVKDKFDVFNKTLMTEAEEKRQIILEEIKNDIEIAREEAEKQAKKESEEVLQKERFKVTQFKNRDYINASIEIKRSLIELRTEYIGKIFDRIIEKLKNYMKTEEYENNLLEEISNYANDDQEVEVMLMNCDLKFSEKIKEISKEKLTIVESKDDFIGGFKVLLKSKHAIYDHTFKSKLDEEIKNINVFKITV